MKTKLNTRLSIYDNGGKSFDRYTIIDNGSKLPSGLYEAIGSCETGVSFYLHIECSKGSHLGKRVNLSELTNDLQRRLKEEFNICDY